MSRRVTKGPRLWLQPERRRANGAISPAEWCILDDGGIKRSTGFGVENRPEAENQLARYLDEKRIATRPRERSATEVAVADVLAIYATDIAPNHSRPKETFGRIERLMAFWGNKALSDVTGQSCRDYAKYRKAQTAARRELEELRAAIRHHRKEGLCRDVVEVVLPNRSQSRERWLTRSEVARLVWAAWRYREVQKGVSTDKRPRQHVARFILLAVYTGTRAATVCAAAFKPLDGCGWIDTTRGVFYRRPEGSAETKKRRPPIPLPPRILAHLRRWERGIQVRDGKRGLKTVRLLYPAEFNGQPVRDIDKAFRRAAGSEKGSAGLSDVTPHTLRHTAATWLMQERADPWEASGYLGMTPETLRSVYGHHHPDHMASALAAFGPRKVREKNSGPKPEQTPKNVEKIDRVTRGK